MKTPARNVYKELETVSLAQYEEQMADNLAEKEPMLNLTMFAEEFASTASAYSVYITVGPNLQILSIETVNVDGVIKLLNALDTIYEELMLTYKNVDTILPHIMLIEDYMRALKSKLTTTALKLN